MFPRRKDIEGFQGIEQFHIAAFLRLDRRAVPPYGEHNAPFDFRAASRHFASSLSRMQALLKAGV